MEETPKQQIELSAPGKPETTRKFEPPLHVKKSWISWVYDKTVMKTYCV